MRIFPAWKKLLVKKRVWFSLVVMGSFALVALLTPLLSPHDPFRWDLTQADLPPMWVQGSIVKGTSTYIFGTDMYGRDVLSRLIYGARTAFLYVLLAVPLTALLGTLIGLIAGYFGGWVDRVLMWITETLQALPGIMVVVTLVLIFRVILTPTWFHGFLTLVIGFMAVSWLGLARLVRMAVLQTKSKLYVEAAVSIGVTPWRLIFSHILPNILHLILVWIVNNVPAIILLEAVLGYIGVGLTSATGGGEFSVISWGGLFYAGRNSMNTNLSVLILPAVCVLLISMSFIFLADELNEQFQQ
ncbi:MAG: ABC transporter permease [Anaerolineaceae bacterium]|jgi:ABC-type dipeptide/oligopeptide/nickel transport system permease subunit